MAFFVEQEILSALRSLLTGRVNEILAELEPPLPPVEMGAYRGEAAVVPAIALSTCERTEKDRIINMDAYSVSISFSVPDMPESDMRCYAYAAAVEKAIMEDPSLGGAASRAVLAEKRYRAPKTPHCGDHWELVLNLRVVAEGLSYAG